MAQNDKKLCLSPLLSQEPYVIWFLGHIGKMKVSPAIFLFFFFKILIFLFFRAGGRKRAKNDP